MQTSFVFHISFLCCKSEWFAVWFQYTLIALNLAYNKKKLYKTLGYWSSDMLTFLFLEKDLGILSPAHFVYVFSRKMFLILCSINLPNLNVWLSLLLQILVKMCIAIVYYPGYDVINFQTNISNQAVFLHYQKLKTKIYISCKRKEILRWNKKHFSPFLKGFQSPKVV